MLNAARGLGPPVTIFGDDYPTRDGTCIRDYIHVADLAGAHVAALGALERDAIECESFNLGSGSGYSVREVLDVAGRITGTTIPTRFGARRPGDPAALIAGSGRVRDALAWAPAHDALEPIVESAWRWMSSR